MSKHRIPPKPPYYETVLPGTCRWCNKTVGLTKKGKISKSKWHTECLKEYKVINWPSHTRRAVWYRDKGKCNYCSVICSKTGVNKWHMDHIKPLISDPGNIELFKLTNCQTLCVKCHILKTSQEATDRATDRNRKLT